jgi:hypothetical protein
MDFSRFSSVCEIYSSSSDAYAKVNFPSALEQSNSPKSYRYFRDIDFHNRFLVRWSGEFDATLSATMGKEIAPHILHFINFFVFMQDKLSFFSSQIKCLVKLLFLTIISTSAL